MGKGDGTSACFEQMAPRPPALLISEGHILGQSVPRCRKAAIALALLGLGRLQAAAIALALLGLGRLQAAAIALALLGLGRLHLWHDALRERPLKPFKASLHGPVDDLFKQVDRLFDGVHLVLFELVYEQLI